MELLITIGTVALFGMIAISSVAQGKQPQPQVIYIKAEPVDQLRERSGGAALVVFIAVILIAIWLL